MSVSKSEYAAIVSKFLQDMDFQMLPFRFQYDLESHVMNYFYKQPWSEKDHQYAHKAAKTMFTIAMFFPQASQTTQVRIGIMSTYLILLDDGATFLSTAIDNFTSNLLEGKDQEHPILQSFVEFLCEGKKYSSPFVNSMVIQDVINFVAGCIMERDHSVNTVPCSGAINFPSYLREKTGLGELYAFWAFSDLASEAKVREVYLPAIQDMSHFNDQANDILSFYKEYVDGDEEFIYIKNIATVKGITPVEALRFVCSEVVSNVTNVRTMLSKPEHEELLSIANGFFNGIVSWHLHVGRYRLDELPIVDNTGKPFKIASHEPKVNKQQKQFSFENSK